MDLAAWEKQLDQIGSGAAVSRAGGFSNRWGPFFPALIKSVENAMRSVDVLVYIFGSDGSAITIADILKERSSTARVRVLMDEIGSLFGGGASAASSSVLPGFKNSGEIKHYLKAGSGWKCGPAPIRG